MKTPHLTPRRTFLKLGALAGGSALLPNIAAAANAAELPKLPYAVDALEPHLDAMTMTIHHGKHHAAYVANLNAALEKSPVPGQPDLPTLLGDLTQIKDEATRGTVRNNGGGHWNHSFFWETLAPASKSGQPGAALAKAIDGAFGSMAAFKEAFAKASMGRFGSGWAWLIHREGKLAVTSTPNQDNPVMKGVVPDSDLGIPLLGLDVWEHAYYLHYQNRRADYVTAWWNVINWERVSDCFEKAS